MEKITFTIDTREYRKKMRAAIRAARRLKAALDDLKKTEPIITTE